MGKTNVWNKTEILIWMVTINVDPGVKYNRTTDAKTCNRSLLYSATWDLALYIRILDSCLVYGLWSLVLSRICVPDVRQTYCCMKPTNEPETISDRQSAENFRTRNKPFWQNSSHQTISHLTLTHWVLVPIIVLWGTVYFTPNCIGANLVFAMP